MKDLKKHFAKFEMPGYCVLEPGVTLKGFQGGSYQVMRDLGSGAFGTVYLVEGHAPEGPSGAVPEGAKKNLYALKVLKLWTIPGKREKEQIQARFVREFEISQDHKSPHLVRSFDCGKESGNPWFVMEYCDHGSFARNNSLVGKSLSYINSVAHQILLGLQVLHRKGLVHRDIKPANILLKKDKVVALTDFGIAGDKNNRMTIRNIFGNAAAIFGTYAYMAPEQSNNREAFKSLDAVADIFSFGVTMFELLIGEDEYPFLPKLITEADLADYTKNKMEGKWENLERRKGELPGDWYKIIKKCLEPDHINKRYKSVDQIIEEIGYISTGIERNPHNTLQNDFVLKVTYGAELGRIYNLSQLLGKDRSSGLLTLGRKDPDIQNHIEVLEDEPFYISRMHCTIEKRLVNGRRQWWVRDGQWDALSHTWRISLNGTYVNSVKVDMYGVEVNPNDIVATGDTTFLLNER
jgi:serine/threonine protein kinase